VANREALYEAMEQMSVVDTKFLRRFAFLKVIDPLA
jgi:hypothetical protein